jgi:hypothetical protein
MMLSGNGLATIYQSDGSCEGFRAKGAKVVADISGLSPEAICSQRLDSYAKLPPGIPSGSLKGDQVFKGALECKQ